jgi:hypothetical protein
MNELNRPNLGFVLALLKVWDVCCRIYHEKGLDLNARLNSWAHAQRAGYRIPQITTDFDELCRDGCRPQALAVLLFLISKAPKLEVWWSSFAGQPKTRRSATKTLTAAASTLEAVFARFIVLEDDEVRRKLQEAEMIAPSVLISELRFYATVFAFAEFLRAQLETRSPAQLGRFLLTYYVERATGRPHDRNIATLLTEAQNLESYDEVAQRMWRDRNYNRLSKHHEYLGDLVFSLSCAIFQQT